MKWFQHVSTWTREPGMSAYIDETGLAGYGFIMRLYEVIAQEWEAWNPDTAPMLTLTLCGWARLLGIHRNSLDKYLAPAIRHGLVEVSPPDTLGYPPQIPQGNPPRYPRVSPPDTLGLYAPKLLQIKDNHSRRSVVTTAQDREEIKSKEDQDQKAEILPSKPRVSRQRGEGVESIGNILGLGGLNEHGELPDRILRITGEAAWTSWWRSVLESLDATGRTGELEGWIRYAEDCADPAKRQLKDLGELREPGPFLVGKAIAILKRCHKPWPDFPAKAAANA